MARTRDFAEVIRRKMQADPKLAKEIKESRFHSALSRRIYDLRTAAGLSQAKLAELVDTTQSVISRIEHSDYEGHSIFLLWRIAEALGAELKVDFITTIKYRSRGNRSVNVDV